MEVKDWLVFGGRFLNGDWLVREGLFGCSGLVVEGREGEGGFTDVIG